MQCHNTTSRHAPPILDYWILRAPLPGGESIIRLGLRWRNSYITDWGQVSALSGSGSRAKHYGREFGNHIKLSQFTVSINMAEEIRKIDGVPITMVQNDKAPELAMKPAFLSTFGLAIDRGSKLGLGKTKTLICSYSQYQFRRTTGASAIVLNISCN
ncbi:hypothetical protein Trydic_g16275 [Trypoxylus dichotomus]